MDKKKQELLELVGHAQNMKRALYRPQFGMLTVGEFLNAYRGIPAKKLERWRQACVRCGFGDLTKRSLSSLEWIELEVIVREFGEGSTNG